MSSVWAVHFPVGWIAIVRLWLLKAYCWECLSSWFKFHRQELPLPLCTSYDLLSQLTVLKRNFYVLCSHTEHGFGRKFKKGSSTSPLFPTPPFTLCASPISSSLLPHWWQFSIWYPETTLAEEKSKSSIAKLVYFSFWAKVLHSSANWGNTGLCDILEWMWPAQSFWKKTCKNVYCPNPVPIPGDHDQYGCGEMQLPKAAGKADIWHSEQKQAIAYGFSVFILFCHEGSI